MAGYHHPKLSPSCVQRAFGHIHWTTIHHHHEEGRRSTSSHDNLFSTIAAISRPELALLQSAEDHPLEYTLASKEDSFVYTRILLKVLDQVTSSGVSSNSDHNTTSPISSSPQRVFSEPSSLSRVPQYSHPPSHEHNHDFCVADFSLGTPLLSEEEALDVYHHDPKGVVTHYVLSKLYDMIGLVLEAQRDAAIGASSSNNINKNGRRRPSKQRQQLQLSALFYHPETRQLLDDWRPLLRICYRCGSPPTARRSSLSVGDEYSQRGASILLAYILKAGCDLEDNEPGNKQGLSQRQRRHSNTDRYGSEGAAHFDHLDATEEGMLLPPLFMDVIEEKKSSHSFDYNDSSLFPTPRGSLKDEVPSNLSSNQVTETLQSLISWLTSRLQSSHNSPLGVVTPTLMVLATTPLARIAFDHAGGIGYLARHLKQFAQRNHRRHLTTTHRSPINRQTHQQPYQDDEMNSFSFVDAANAVASSVLAPTRASSSSKLTQQQFPVRRNSSLSSFYSTTSNNSNNNSSRLHETITNGIQDLTSSIHGIGHGIQEYFPLGVAAAPPSSPHKREVELIDVAPITMNGNSPGATLFYGGTNNSQSSTHQRRKSSLAAATGPSLPTPSSNSVQQLYELVFTLWCMTLDCCFDNSNSSRNSGCHERNLYYNNDVTNSMRHHFVRDGAVSALAQLLNAAPREKVLRLALASLKNLATMDGNENEDDGNVVSVSSNVDHGIRPSSSVSDVTSTTLVREMIACDVLKSLELLQLRQWNDEDLRDDLNMLQSTLQWHFAHLTQWKVYQAQLDAGVLRWNSLLHTEIFFQRNAQFMEGPEGDFAPLKRLIELLARRTTQQTQLSSSAMTNHSFYYVGEIVQNVDIFRGNSFEEDDVDDDELCETLSICLHDLGEFARQYPNGRILAKQLGANKLAMRYLHHPHTGVQQEALLCVSKLLVHDWRVSLCKYIMLRC